MNKPTVQLGDANWAYKEGNLLGYAQEEKSLKYIPMQFNVNRASKKTVLGPNGTLVTYDDHEPSFEYDNFGKFKGLLIEPEATNLCLQSEDINTTWGDTNATPTQSTETTPDGDSTNKYIKLVDDNGGGTGFVYIAQSITVSGGTKYTASVFLKKGGLNWARITAVGANAVGDANPAQYFNLDTGVLGSGSPGIDDATIEEYPNGWYRCSITWTQGVGDTSFDFRVWVASDNNNVTVDRDGTSSIFVWGAQVEAGPVATSYISTKPKDGQPSKAEVRIKDDIYLAGAANLIGQKATGGTLYIEVDWIRPLGYLLSVSDGTVNNMAIIYNGINQELRMYLNSNSANLTNQGESHINYSGIQKFAFAYADNDFELYRNGSSVSSYPIGDLSDLATLFRIDIGQSPGTTATTHAHIRAVAIYNKRLSNSELAELTTI